MTDNETYTLEGLLAAYPSGIVIPRLQRDYAQGRPEAESIRRQLLSDILQEDCDLGIVYGARLDGSFLPVDGQQRLTTLWLTALYMRKVRGEGVEIDLLKHFSYQTRTSSQAFCKSLIEEDWDVADPDRINDLKEHLTQQHWYLWYWRQDPTAEAMLNTLQTLHRLATQEKLAPKDPCLGNVTLHALRVDKSQKPGELYTKMNSRGKELTTFEIIKAHLDELLPDKDTDFARQWRQGMDNEWYLLFWHHHTVQGEKDRAAAADGLFASTLVDIILSLHAANVTASNDNDLQQIANAENLNVDTDNAAHIWDTLRPLLGEGETRQSRLEFIAEFLNRAAELRECNPAEWWSEPFKPLWKEDDFDLVAPEPRSRRSRALLLGLALYRGESFKESAPGWHDWKRTVHNLVENASLNDTEAFARLCRKLSELAAHSTDIVTYLAQTKLPGTAGEQEREEKAKATQLLGEPTSRPAIEKGERHALLRGRLGALLGPDAGTPEWKQYKTRLEHLYAIADGAEGQLLVNEAAFVRAVIACNTDFFGQLTRRFLFDTGASNQRGLLSRQDMRPLYAGLLMLDDLNMVKSASDYRTEQLLRPGVVEWALERERAHGQMWVAWPQGLMHLYRRYKQDGDLYYGLYDNTADDLQAQLSELADSGVASVDISENPEFDTASSGVMGQERGPRRMWAGKDIHFEYKKHHFVLELKRWLGLVDAPDKPLWADVYNGNDGRQLTDMLQGLIAESKGQA